MKPGARPKPVALKRLAGNPGKRKLNDKEPKIKAPLKHAPDWMNEEQLEIWRYALNHAPAGVLGTVDRDLLATWVTACYYRNKAVEMQNSLDEQTKLKLMTKTQSGDVRQSPYLVTFRQQSEIMHRSAGELGFTPSARSRLTAEDTDENANPFASV
jgi:P27 family predicted phage terminase small subunit